MKEQILLVVNDENLYFFPACSEFTIVSSSRLLTNEYYKEHISQLAQLELVVFLDYGFKVAMAEKLRGYTPAKIILFFWNHLTETHLELLREAQKSAAIDDIYHFDALEAQQYNLKHNSSFYRKPNLDPDTIEKKYDLFLGATNSGRKKEADFLQQAFDDMQLSYYFHFLSGIGGHRQAGFMPYHEYLEKTLEAQATVELMRPGQTGLTLRSLETIYWPIKLVTNNPVIEHYRFYHPDNIFVVGKDPLDQLPNFLKKPSVPIPSEIKEFYQPINWAQRFLKEDVDYGELEYHPTLFLKNVSDL